jgi:hypothetical protein
MITENGAPLRPYVEHGAEAPIVVRVSSA